MFYVFSGSCSATLYRKIRGLSYFVMLFEIQFATWLPTTSCYWLCPNNYRRAKIENWRAQFITSSLLVINISITWMGI